MDNIPKGPHLVHPRPPDEAGNADQIGARELVNRFNALHFRNGTFLLRLQNPRNPHQILTEVRPTPTSGERLRCLWTDPPPSAVLAGYLLSEALLDVDGRLFSIHPETPSLDDSGANFSLPTRCRDINARRIRRLTGVHAQAQMLQNGVAFHGTLRDFTPVALRVEVAAEQGEELPWLDPDAPLTLQLTSAGVTLFAGECRLLRHDSDGPAGSLVLAPVNSQLRRFRTREFRSLRRRLLPPPDIAFRHPLSDRHCQLPVLDLSGGGFAVEEEEATSLLIPGLILPEVELRFAASSLLRCKAQVVYRHSAGTEPGRVRCGLAILDLEPHQQVRLLALLQQADDRNAYLCAPIDLDELWQFLFATGFLYPEKYRALQADRESFLATYQKLYQQQLDIARHFVYREGGEIRGHIAMLRLYRSSWMIHHHAASHAGSRRAGLAVLGQISRFVSELHRLRSARLGYVFCYYRPENRFPSRLFGGAAKAIGDTAGCAVTPFAYFEPRRGEVCSWELPGHWQLLTAAGEDLLQLRLLLEAEGAGLVIPAFDLQPGADADDELAREYARVGLRRERRLYALKCNGELRAVLLLHLSTAGLNLSSLTSSIQVFILDRENLPPEVLNGAVGQLRVLYEDEVPAVLVHPAAWAERHALGHDKLYQLWILNLQHLDGYFRFCNRFLRNT